MIERTLSLRDRMPILLLETDVIQTQRFWRMRISSEQEKWHLVCNVDVTYRQIAIRRQKSGAKYDSLTFIL